MYGRIGRQKMLAEIYKECGSLLWKGNTTMTDKEIIIDDVDVSGCKYYDAKKLPLYNCLKCINHFKPCLGNNCYYKQLKAKEQECDELNKWLPIVTRLEEQFKSHEKAKSIGYKTYAEQVFTELDQLKAENEELKKINLHIDNNREHKANKLMRIEKLIIACSTGYTDEFIQELLVILHEPEPNSFENKYKQALTEIKQIVLDLGYIDILGEQILQKCEVLDE